MKIGILTSGLILLAAAAPALAANELSLSRDQTMAYDQNPSDLYRANELSLDAFGTASLGRHTINHLAADRIRNNTVLGAGLGANYFILRYVGVGGDLYTENTDHALIDNASGNIIFRYPIGNTGLAPYVYGGGGYKFDPVQTSFAQVGGGLEYRFTPHIGIFVDARYVFADRISDYGVGRAGFRWAF